MSKRLGRRKHRRRQNKPDGKSDVTKVTVELRSSQDRELERIKLHYRDRSTPRVDKKDLIQRAVDMLIAEFKGNKDFLLPRDE